MSVRNAAFDDEDLYAVLDVPRGAPDPAIRAGYRAASMRVHPDRNPDADADRRAELNRLQQLVNHAWAVLGDPARRAAYDARLAREGRHAFRADPPGRADAWRGGSGWQDPREARARAGAGWYDDASGRDGFTDRRYGGTGPFAFEARWYEAAEFHEVELARFRQRHGAHARPERRRLRRRFAVPVREQVSGGESRIKYGRYLYCGACEASGSIRVGIERCGACGNDPLRRRWCTRCTGSGEVERTVPCDACQGAGHRKLDDGWHGFAFGRGLRDGERILLRDDAFFDASAHPVEIELEVRIECAPLHTVDGDDLCCTVPVGAVHALLGLPVRVPFVDGEGTVSGYDALTATEIVVDHQGLSLRDGSRGRLRVRLEILNDHARSLMRGDQLRTLAALLDDESRALATDPRTAAFAKAMDEHAGGGAAKRPGRRKAEGRSR